MNHLKYICGINISRRAPSGATLPSRYGQHIDDVHLKNHQFRSQLSGSHPLFLIKRNHGSGIKTSEQSRQDGLRLVSKESKTIYKPRSKSNLISLKKKSSSDKKLSLESIAKTMCHYSTCQNIKFNCNEINKQNTSRNVKIVKSAKNINRNNSFVASVEKYNRSYAEMIAAYSENFCKKSSMSIQNDNVCFNNTIHKNTLTFLTPSSAKKILNFTDRSKAPTEIWKNDSFPPVEASNYCDINNVKRHEMCNTAITNKSINQDCIIKNDLKDDKSYAKLVADYSKSAHDISFANISNSDLPARNALARNSLESLITSSRKVNSMNTQGTLQKVSPTITMMPLKKNVKERMIDLKKTDWLRDDVINDLRTATRRKNTKTVEILKTEESDTLHPADVYYNYLEKVQNELSELIKAHERKEKDTAVKETNYQSSMTDKMEKRDFELQKNYYPQLSNMISQQHFTTAKNLHARKNSTHIPSNTISTLKQPQIKLRMVPSEQESVVSINVDSVSASLSDPLNSASKQLSVVVQSDRKESPQSTENQRNITTLRHNTKSGSQRTDFGPMRISISEDSAPVKQIEFSINGKPVSELKSITARTERLDVVSSVDKIEIRIPFAKDESNVSSKIGKDDLSRGIDLSTEQILNVQISANFQNGPRKGAAEKPIETIQYQHHKNPIPSTSSLSKSHYLPNESVGIREENFNSNNAHHAMTNILSIEQANKYPKDGNVNMKKMKSTTQFPEVKKNDQNESSDHRVPSKMIPWWSSADSFNKIKKREDYHKPQKPLLNMKKATSNLNKNLNIEPASSKSKQTPSLKTLTKRTEKKTIVTTNNPSNLISYSNSVEQRLKSKPTFQQSSTSNLNWEHLLKDIPGIVGNNFKTSDNQMSTIKESNQKVSESKQVEPITSNTINVWTYAQALPSKKNRQEKGNNLPNQTKSINNICNTKSKMENISDAVKSIENKKDGASIDRDLKISSKKTTVELNSKVNEVENSPSVTIRAKDIISTTDVSKKEQSVKTILPQQIELNKTQNIGMKTDISKGKEDLTLKEVKNIVTTYVKEENKNDITNIKRSNAAISNSSKLTQTLIKQEKLAEDTIILQDNSKENSKSLSKYSSLSSTISSGKIQKSDKVGILPSKETQRNKQKISSGVKSTPEIVHESVKFKNMTFSELQNNTFKQSSDKKIIDQKKSSLETTNKIQTKINTNASNMIDMNKLSSSQTKSNPISKIKDPTIFKNLMDKTTRLSITDQSVKKVDENIGAKNMKILSENLKSKNLLPKDCNENSRNKSMSAKDKKHPSGSAGSSKKPSDLTAGVKSADLNTKSRVMLNDNCSYTGKLFIESYSNFNRNDNIVLNLQSATFKKISRILNKVDDVPDHHVPNIIGNGGPWTDVNRPEKNILYSAWLQRSRIDINENEKLL